MTDTPSPRELPNVAIPSHLVAALNYLPDAAPPMPGSVWRLEFGGQASLVYVHQVQVDHAFVVPVGLDLEMADAATLLVDAEESPLDIPVAIWVSCIRSVPLFTFDRPVGDLDRHKEVDRLLDWLADPGDATLEDVLATGPPIFSGRDPRPVYRAELEQPLIDLASTAELLDQDAPPPSKDLGDLLRAAHLKPSTLQAELNWTTERARSAFQGTLVITSAEARLLAERFGLDVDHVMASVQLHPPQLQLALHERQWRSAVRGWADQRDLAVPQARTEIAEQVLLSSRRAGGDNTAEPPWHDLLADFFQAS